MECEKESAKEAKKKKGNCSYVAPPQVVWSHVGARVASACPGSPRAVMNANKANAEHDLSETH